MGGARPPRGAAPDALAGQHLAHEAAALVVGQRGDERGVEAEPRGGYGRDRPTAGRAQEVAGEALVAEAGQGFQPHEGEVDEGWSGNRQVGAHAVRAYRPPESSPKRWRVRGRRPEAGSLRAVQAPGAGVGEAGIGEGDGDGDAV